MVHDLRVYAQPHRATVRFYRDNKGVEVDAIVEAASGRWIAVEAKLEHQRVDEVARNLLLLRNKPTADVNEACDALIVVVADSATYIRPDGVIVTSIACPGTGRLTSVKVAAVAQESSQVTALLAKRAREGFDALGGRRCLGLRLGLRSPYPEQRPRTRHPLSWTAARRDRSRVACL